VAAIRRFLFTAALVVCLERASYSKTDLDFVVNTLYQSGHGGKQVYDGKGDQTLSLYEPVLYINSQIDHETSVFGSAVFDALSSASNKAFDSGTGASGGKKAGGDDGEGGDGGEGLFPGWQTRVGLDGGYSKKLGTWVLTPTAGYSSELSYRSLHGGLNVQKFFAEDNFVVSAGYFHFADAANPWDLAKSKFAGFKAKTTNSANLSVSQLLSADDMVLGGISYTRQGGFLEGTRNTVSTGTVTQRASEALPQGRDKFTANTRYVRSLGPNLAFHLDYRYYKDSWNIRANTWEPSLAIAFSEEKGVLRLLYRRYSQTAAKYYAVSFPGVQNRMTSDSDLAKFTANEAGAQFSYALEPGEDSSTDWSWGGTAVYYKRSNDLQAMIFQVSLNAKF
jgi:hypothetical protein